MKRWRKLSCSRANSHSLGNAEGGDSFGSCPWFPGGPGSKTKNLATAGTRNPGQTLIPKVKTDFLFDYRTQFSNAAQTA